MQIINARKEHASDVARLIMMAMTDDCCQFLAGPAHSLGDFHRLLTGLVEAEQSQYSYRNTLLAVEAERVIGVCVSYDGALLIPLREAFLRAAQQQLGMDHSQMAPETEAGELYVDSLAVLPEFRRRGVASALLCATAEKARRMGIPCVGLLVDQANLRGQNFYRSLGFQHVGDGQWGGHPMHHLQLSVFDDFSS